MSHLFYGRIRRGPEGYLVPRGTIIAHVGTLNIPVGWLPCWGQEVSRTTHSKLFEIVGTTFGEGDGETTFNLPDLRGRSILGNGRGEDLTHRTVGRAGGDEDRTLEVANLPSHSHTGTTDSSGAHTHTSNADGSTYSLSTYTGGNTAGTGLDNSSSEPDLFADAVALTINSAGAHTHTFTTNTTGSGTSFSIMHPYLVMTYLIRI